MINLSAFIRYHATNGPDRLAVVYGETRATYADLWRGIGRVAGLLAARGIGPGDTVALFMKNSLAFLELAFAASHVGAVLLPINFRLSADEARYILDNGEAKLLFADEDFAPMFVGRRDLIVVPAAGQQGLSDLASGATEPPMAVRGTEDLLRLMYTSGTTSRPKGVMISYENFYWKSMEHVIALGLGQADRVLVVGPLYHVGALDLPGLAVLWLGGTLIVMREFEAETVLATLARERVTGAWLAPTMTNQILALPRREDYDVSALRWVIGGGEKTPESRIRAFAQAFPKARYVDAYGLTESVSGDTFMVPGFEIAKIGSTGRATPHVEIEIRDDDGRRLSPGQTGEICLRGPKVTKGYWKDVEKTRASFFGDWFRTGDVGYLDADGFLYLTDRKKDLIISGGENIASPEVERVIYDLPEVEEAAVVGLPDPQWGERPVAVVVLRPGAELDHATLARHCRQHLAGFKVPKELYLRAALPRNPSGKVLKRVLRDELAALSLKT